MSGEESKFRYIIVNSITRQRAKPGPHIRMLNEIMREGRLREGEKRARRKRTEQIEASSIL
jgi:hypothetical protein